MFLQMSLPGPHASPYSDMVAEASPTGGDGVSLDRVKVVAGRMFNPADPHAVVIDQHLADLAHVRLGGTLHLIGYPQRGNNPDVAHAARLAFRVSAIVVFSDQIVSGTKELSEPRILFSPAFARTPQARSFNPAGGAAYVMLRSRAERRSRSPTRQPLWPGGTGWGTSRWSTWRRIRRRPQRAIRPEAVALAIFAALVGLIGLALMAQLLSRQIALDSVEFPILRGLGMTRSRLVMLSLAGVAVVTGAGAVLAVGIAVAASPLMPIGPARLAEPSPGVEINLAILGAGFAAIAVVPLLVVVPAALRAAARAQGALGLAEPGAPAHASRLGPALGRAGSVAGQPGGADGVRARARADGGAGAQRPGGDDGGGGSGGGGDGLRRQLPRAGRHATSVRAELGPGAGSAGRGSTGRHGRAGAGAGHWPDPVRGRQLRAGQRRGAGHGSAATIPAIGLDQLHGNGFLTLLAGRAPAGPGEIALGPRTLRTLGLHLGQRVEVSANGRTSPMRIVGSAVFASFSVGGGSATDLGTGAVVPASVLSQPNPQSCPGHVTCYNFFLLRYRPGTDLRSAAAQLRRVVTRDHCPPGLCLVTADQRPSDIQNYTGVRDTPLVLGAVLALLAVGTLAHVLLTGVRRRRRDLAVLKTLGLLRSQLLRVVSWQAIALAAAALLVGLPLGLLAGRWAWLLFADSAGVGSQADVPVPLVLLVIPVTLILAVLLAVVPGWTAARIRPALILRSE